jgi:hypothetical protein
MWLTGILKDTLTFNRDAFRSEIDGILEDLCIDEANRVKKYI